MYVYVGACIAKSNIASACMHVHHMIGWDLEITGIQSELWLKFSESSAYYEYWFLILNIWMH